MCELLLLAHISIFYPHHHTPPIDSNGEKKKEMLVGRERVALAGLFYIELYMFERSSHPSSRRVHKKYKKVSKVSETKRKSSPSRL
jgi:hypothetical protein